MDRLEFLWVLPMTDAPWPGLVETFRAPEAHRAFLSSGPWCLTKGVEGRLQVRSAPLPRTPPLTMRSDRITHRLRRLRSWPLHGDPDRWLPLPISSDGRSINRLS